MSECMSHESAAFWYLQDQFLSHKGKSKEQGDSDGDQHKMNTFSGKRVTISMNP